MKLIVGLGNPGRIYTETRHNIGFSVVRSLSRIYKIPLKKDSNTFSLSGKGKIEDDNIILALPLTFMNLSGNAIKTLLRKYKIDLPPRSFSNADDALRKKGQSLENLLVVYDDLDLGLGTIRIRPCGSSGGHRGIKSIIETIRSQEFPRLRVGISSPLKDNISAADFVLSSFSKKEKEKVEETIERAAECCRIWATEGITESMNIFNRAPQKRRP